MRVAVLGLGRVGVVTALGLADIGHDVTAVDTSEEVVDRLRAGQLPFVEPGAGELLRKHFRERFTATTNLSRGVAGAELIFICVGTPSRPSGDPDLSQIELLAIDLAPHIGDGAVIVEKSTVPSGTGEQLCRTLRRELGHDRFGVVSNPEFLSEGTALVDALRPSRIVIGSQDDDATDRLVELYRPIIESTGCPVLITDVRTAELIKHASNAFLATKVSFINAVSEICERLEADVEVVARGMGLDARIGPAFLRAGAGYGGSCFPKDVAAFASMAAALGVDFGLLRAVQKTNERAPARLVEKLERELSVLEGKRIAILGLAFKPGTDDLRDAPALEVIDMLRDGGAEVVAYDPVAMGPAKELLHGVRFAASPHDALAGCDAAAVLTEWPALAEMEPRDFKDGLRHPVVVDGRNLFSPEKMAKGGVTYIATGRPRATA